MPRPAYNEYVELLSNKFLSRLNDILPDYNFDYGVEFEIAVCEILRAFLPEKYGVCRGHIVDFEGNSVGDDIIIYDQQTFPTIRLHDKRQFARKENIAIEAVYAYFEAKHTLNHATFDKALKQIQTVKEFVSKRKKTEIETFDPYLAPLDRVKNYSNDYPSFRNPIFCGIIARKTEFTFDEIEKFEIELKKNQYNPELIIFSKESYLQIGYDNESDSDFTPTNFLLVDKNYSYSHIQTTGDLSFGMFLMEIISALDWIRLGRINWINVANHYIKNVTKNNNK